jgi:hypothetical protein
MNLVEKYLIGFEPMTSVLTWHYSTTKLSEKPFIGFEPMTYALPWHYSTTELKGLFIQFKN